MKQKRKTDRQNESWAIFDDVVVSMASQELIRSSTAPSKDLANLFGSIVVTWPYRKHMERSEMISTLGAVHWAFRKTQSPVEMFCAMGILHKGMPIGYLLRHMAEYGVRSLIQDARTVDGAIAWASGVAYVFVCSTVQAWLFLAEAPVNAKRKLFHGALFFYSAIFPLKIVRTQGMCVLFFLHLASRLFETHGRQFNISEKSVFSKFLSQKDKKKVSSHIYLLAGFLFAIEGIQEDRSRLFFILSAVGVIDGVASFFPRSKNTHKSKIGSCVGAVTAKTILTIFFQINYPMWMYFLLGMGEYHAHMNDNILLPIFAYGITCITIQ